MNESMVDFKVSEWFMSGKHWGVTYWVNEEGQFCAIDKGNVTPIYNFFMIPTEKIVKINDDGVKEIKKYIFEGTVNNTIKEKFEVQADELLSSRWIIRWNIHCKILKGSSQKNYSIFKDFLLDQVDEIPERIVYDSIGWHQHNNQWFFLYSGGKIGETEGNTSTTAMNFKPQLNKKLSEKDSFYKSLELLDITNHKVTYSLLSFLLTSVITTPLMKNKNISPDYVLWIVGDTGVGKTRFTSFFTGIYHNKNLTRPDAHKTIEILPGLRDHKDCIFIIDDYGTAKSRRIEIAVIEKVEGFIRSIGDRKDNVSSVSEGMILITGEKFIDHKVSNESSTLRTIRVEMEGIFDTNDDDFIEQNREKRSKLEEYTKEMYLPTSIFHYLSWLSQKLNSNFIDDYKKDFDTLKDELSTKYPIAQFKDRYIDAFAHQIIAFNRYMAYGRDKEFISPLEYYNNTEYAKDLFFKILEDQNKVLLDKNVKLFLKTINQLIIDEKIYVKYDKKVLDFDKNRFGVVITDEKQQLLKLDWDSVYNLVSESIYQEHKTTIIGKNLLGKMLDEYNFIYKKSKDTTTVFYAWNNFEKERCRVINFKTKMIPEIMDTIEKMKNKKYRPEDRKLAMLGKFRK